MYSGYFLYSASYSSCILAIFCILSVLCLSSCILQLYPGCILQVVQAIFSILQLILAKFSILQLVLAIFSLLQLYSGYIHYSAASCILAIFSILQLYFFYFLAIFVFWLYLAPDCALCDCTWMLECEVSRMSY